VLSVPRRWISASSPATSGTAALMKLTSRPMVRVRMSAIRAAAAPATPGPLPKSTSQLVPCSATNRKYASATARTVSMSAASVSEDPAGAPGPAPLRAASS
jgi:hypothetical protein